MHACMRIATVHGKYWKVNIYGKFSQFAKNFPHQWCILENFHKGKV